MSDFAVLQRNDINPVTEARTEGSQQTMWQWRSTSILGNKHFTFAYQQSTNTSIKPRASIHSSRTAKSYLSIKIYGAGYATDYGLRIAAETARIFTIGDV